MGVEKVLINIENFLGIKCTHQSVKNSRCNFCPDCGEKIVVRWVSIKCKQCGHLRAAVRRNFHLIFPKKNFCFYCGSDKWVHQYYFDSNIPDKLREISIKQAVTDKENPFKTAQVNTYTNIWVEKPQTVEKKFKSNVIKAGMKREQKG